MTIASKTSEARAILHIQRMGSVSREHLLLELPGRYDLSKETAERLINQWHRPKPVLPGGRQWG